MSDHKDDAKEFLLAAGVRGYSTDQNIAAAQVHATLHLAEQQRISNLIAYISVLETQYAESARHPDEYDQSTKADSLKRYSVVVGQIKEGLGL